MKIAILDKEELLKISGLPVYTQRLKKHLESKGHKVKVIRYANNKTNDTDILPIPYYYAEPRSLILAPSEKTPALIETYLESFRPDLFYVYPGLSIFDFMTPDIAHKKNIPIAGVFHGDFNDRHGFWQYMAKSALLTYVPFCKQLDLLHVFSDKLKGFFVRRGIDPEKIIVLPNGVDTALYRPGTSLFAKKHSIKTGVLFLGRLTLVKNPELVIKSFLSLNTSKDTKLILVGHGDLEEKLKHAYTDERIIFTGGITDEKQKIDIIRACQTIVLPSLWEGMSLALLEAMACGLAPITSDAGTKPVFGQAGCIIPIPELNKKLPQVLGTFLADKPLLKKRGILARKAIIQKYVQSDIFDRLISAFEDTITQYHAH